VIIFRSSISQFLRPFEIKEMGGEESNLQQVAFKVVRGTRHVKAA
jgi:hypothetical protein